MVKDIQTWMKCGETSIPSTYTAVPSKTFKKSWKKYSKSGIPGLSRLQDVVASLVNNIKLVDKYKDHSLQGNMSGLRECHIFPDLLLIYSIDEDLKEINLVDFGTHSQLFG
jgi:mRNA interferase YafQ